MIGSVSGYTTPKEMKGSVTLMTQRQKALLSCAVAAALLLSGCRKGNSDSGSMSSSNAMSGSSGSASTTQTGGWKTGLGILTEASDEARTGTIHTIAAAVLLDEFENDNPFKANYRVSLADLSQMQAMSQNFQSIPGVYSVTAPIEMTQTFVEVQRAVTKVGQIVILVLMAVSIITVGSTIRLSVFARRREIEIMKYVGATNHLVTLPFFVEGLTMGLISGAITSVTGIFGYAYIVQASSTLGGLWQLLMGTAMVPVDAVWPTILTYSLAGGALVGALGSMFSIRKHLNV